MESYKTYIAEDRGAPDLQSTDERAQSEGQSGLSATEADDIALRQVGNGRSRLVRKEGIVSGESDSDCALVETLPELLGSFGYDMIRREGLEEVAEAIHLGARLDAEDGNLLQRSSYPALGKLLELQRMVRAAERGHGLLPARRRFILYTPVAEAIERLGAAAAVESCATRLTELAQKTAQPLPKGAEPHPDILLIALDRWVGNFSQEALLSVLSDLLGVMRGPDGIEANSLFRIGFFGPTTGELKQMLRGKDSVPSRLVSAEVPALQQLLSHLRNAGIESVEGGGDLAVLHTAITAGLDVTVTHDLTRFRLAGQAPAAGRDGSLLASILESRTRLIDDVESQYAGKGAPQGRWRCWYPWLPSALDSTFRSDQPLGLEVVSAVALVRLMVPELDYVGAPLSLCGPNAAEIAHHFGANDIGFIAPDAESAAQLGVAENHPKSDALYRRILAAQRDGAPQSDGEEQLVESAEEA